MAITDTSLPVAYQTWTYGGHVYGLYKTPSTWTQAAANADAVGGYLAKIDTSEENQFLFSKLKEALTSSDLSSTSASDGGSSAFVWLGASDAAKEGTWVWSADGSSLELTNPNWGAGALGSEPDNWGGQNYLALGLNNWPKGAWDNNGYGNAGQWNDLNGLNKLYYIVEQGATPTVELIVRTETNDIINDFLTIDCIISEEDTNFNAGSFTLTDAYFKPAVHKSPNEFYIVAKRHAETASISVNNNAFTNSQGVYNKDGNDANNHINITLNWKITAYVYDNELYLGEECEYIIENKSVHKEFWYFGEAAVSISAIEETLGADHVYYDGSYTSSFLEKIQNFAPSINILVADDMLIFNGRKEALNKVSLGSVILNICNGEHVIKPHTDFSFKNIHEPGPGEARQVHDSVDVIVSQNFGDDAILLTDIERITLLDYGLTVLKYQDQYYDYAEIDPLISISTVNGEFSEEFRKELTDLGPVFKDCNYADLVNLVGLSNIDGFILDLAGRDGNYVG